MLLNKEEDYHLWRHKAESKSTLSERGYLQKIHYYQLMRPSQKRCEAGDTRKHTRYTWECRWGWHLTGGLCLGDGMFHQLSCSHGCPNHQVDLKKSLNCTPTVPKIYVKQIAPPRSDFKKKIKKRKWVREGLSCYFFSEDPWAEEQSDHFLSLASSAIWSAGKVCESLRDLSRANSYTLMTFNRAGGILP